MLTGHQDHYRDQPQESLRIQHQQPTGHMVNDFPPLPQLQTHRCRVLERTSQQSATNGVSGMESTKMITLLPSLSRRVRAEKVRCPQSSRSAGTTVHPHSLSSEGDRHYSQFQPLSGSENQEDLGKITHPHPHWSLIHKYEGFLPTLRIRSHKLRLMHPLIRF